jgi:hypothetical protein
VNKGNDISIKGTLDFNKLKRYDHKAFLGTELGNRIAQSELRELTVAPALQPVRIDKP